MLLHNFTHKAPLINATTYVYILYPRKNIYQMRVQTYRACANVCRNDREKGEGNSEVHRRIIRNITSTLAAEHISYSPIIHYHYIECY